MARVIHKTPILTHKDAIEMHAKMYKVDGITVVKSGKNPLKKQPNENLH